LTFSVDYTCDNLEGIASAIEGYMVLKGKYEVKLCRNEPEHDWKDMDCVGRWYLADQPIIHSDTRWVGISRILQAVILRCD